MTRRDRGQIRNSYGLLMTGSGSPLPSWWLQRGSLRQRARRRLLDCLAALCGPRPDRRAAARSGRARRLIFFSCTASALALLVPGVQVAYAQCPPNAYVERITEEGNVTTIHCKCNDGFRKEAGQCRSTAGEELPSIDPVFFVTDDERRSLCERIQGLTAKQAKYRAQLDRLEAVQAGLRKAADVYEVRNQLLLDLGADSLDMAIASVDVMLDFGVISTAAGKARAANSLTLLKSAKFGVNSVAATSAPADSKREIFKAIDAAFSLKDLVPGVPGVSAEQWKYFNRASNMLPKMLQISERHVDDKGDEPKWQMNLKDIDDGLAAFGKVIPALKAVHSAAHVIDGLGALYLTRHDRDAVDEAFVKAQTARRLYSQRMGDLEQPLAFYRERLARAGMTCP
jgi:hypothetical protein